MDIKEHKNIEEYKSIYPKQETLENIKQKIPIELTNLMNYYIEPFIVFNFNSSNTKDINKELKNLSSLLKTTLSFEVKKNFTCSVFSCFYRKMVFLLSDNNKDLKILSRIDDTNKNITYIDIFVKENNINNIENYISREPLSSIYEWTDLKNVVVSLKLSY
jgi:hypothetical protein